MVCLEIIDDFGRIPTCHALPCVGAAAAAIALAPLTRADSALGTRDLGARVLTVPALVGGCAGTRAICRHFFAHVGQVILKIDHWSY